jgi:pimeloyl-ACP methyl ester carboxylesterase
MLRPIAVIVARSARFWWANPTGSGAPARENGGRGTNWHDVGAGRHDRRVPEPVSPVSHRIAAGPVHLVVHEWGGDGPPVLLAHPTGFHGRIWAPVAARLIARGRTVFSFDFRGHGDSDAPDSDYSWLGFADDVLAVTEHLGLAGDPMLLAAGHSKGGAALVLAEAARPGTYARLWLYEPVIFPPNVSPPREGFSMVESARRRRNEWASKEQAFESYSSKPPLAVMTEASLRAYVDYGLRDRGDGVFELKCRPDIEAQVYAMGPHNGAFARLGEVQPPTLVVCGERTSSIPPDAARTIAERLPHGSLEVMAGVGHFGPQEDPDAAIESMLRFASETLTRP